MSALAELWHVVQKDARHFRWWLAGYVLLVTAATAGAASGEQLAGGRLQWAAALIVLVGPVIAALVVQDDSPLRADAFWASHPFRRPAMLGAKLLMVLGFLLVPPLIGQMLGLLAFDVPAAELRPIMLQSAALFGIVLLFAMFLAALTRDLAAFVLGVLAFLIAAIAAGIVLSGVEWSWWGESALRHVVATLGVVGVATLLILLYLRRNLRWARGLGVAVLAMFLLGTISTGQQQPTLPATDDVPPREAGQPGITVELRDTAEITRSGHVNLRITLIGADSAQRFRLDRPRARFFLHDGTTAAMPLWELGPTILHAGRLVLPGVPSLQEDENRLPALGTATSMAQEVSGELRRQLERGIDSVRIISALTLIEPRIFATLPLRRGAVVLHEGQSVALAELDLSETDAALKLETRTVGTASDRARWMDPATGLNVYLVNERRGEGVALPPRGSGSDPGLLVLPGASVHQGSITYRAPTGTNGSPYSADAEWMRGAKLMLLRWVDGPSYHVSASSVPLPPDVSSPRRQRPFRGIASPSASLEVYR